MCHHSDLAGRISAKWPYPSLWTNMTRRGESGYQLTLPRYSSSNINRWLFFAASLDNTWTGKLSSSIFLKRGYVDSTLRQGCYVLLHKTNIRPGERMNFAQNKEIRKYLEGVCWIYDIRKNPIIYIFPSFFKNMYGKLPKDTEQMNSFKIITTYWTPVELYVAKNSFQCITNYLCIRFP